MREQTSGHATLRQMDEKMSSHLVKVYASESQGAIIHYTKKYLRHRLKQYLRCSIMPLIRSNHMASRQAIVRDQLVIDMALHHTREKN